MGAVAIKLWRTHDQTKLQLLFNKHEIDFSKNTMRA